MLRLRLKILQGALSCEIFNHNNKKLEKSCIFVSYCGKNCTITMKTKLLLLFFPVVLLLSSCMTTKRLNYLQTGSGIPEYADSVEYEDYRLQRGDYIYIRIYSPNPEDLITYNSATTNQQI